MLYKVPKDEEVLKSIKRVMKRHGTINSQDKLRELVERELQKIDKEYRVSKHRVRILAINSSYVSIEIHAREGEARREAISKCPCCSSKLKVIKNKTIFDGIVTLGFSCTLCPYWTGKKRRIPTRYVFHPR